MSQASFWIRITLIAVIAAFLAVAGFLAWKWQERNPVSALGWPVAAASSQSGDRVNGDRVAGDRVTVTWLGITSLLFDDGETQILVDGMFSRPALAEVLTQRRIFSDAATINYALAEYRMGRLAAIVPVHSHFDHAMDVGYVANRTSAVVLGSESTANIARGAGVPVNQYQILANGESRRFGDFEITLIESAHAPVGPDDSGWFPGIIDEPLPQPARIADWRAGTAWSILIGHPTGTALVQGSAGFIEDALPANSAEVVLLGIGGLSSLGPAYVRDYWAHTVTRSGASRVFPIHYDDYTRPFGEILLFPTIVDDAVRTAAWIDELAADNERPVSVQRLPFGLPVAIFGE